MENKSMKSSKNSGCVCEKSGDFSGKIETRFVEIEQKIGKLQEEVQFLQTQIVELKE